MSKLCFVREVDGDLEISIEEMNNRDDFMSLAGLLQKDFGGQLTEKIIGPDAVVFRFEIDGKNFNLICDDFSGVEIRCRADGPKARLLSFVNEIEATFQHLVRPVGS